MRRFPYHCTLNFWIRCQKSFTVVFGFSGGKAIGIPGEISGYYRAWERYGRAKWKDLFGPAIQLARDGFPVGNALHNAIQATENYSQLR